MITIGRYRVLDPLGSGGMGLVFRAADETLRRSVALKFLSPTLASDEEYRARFLREARIAASLNHPNTCVVYEVGQLDLPVTLPPDDTVLSPGTPFIAMEFVEGDTLDARLERSGPLPVAAAIDIALQLAEGLAEAHAQHIVHRDLKPQNVMLTPGGRVKIVDFGLAKPIRTVQDARALVSTSEMISTELGDSTVIGTCAYMSPEQAAGKELDARSDVFSFGTMLYQMLSGRLPFEGDNATETIAKILEADPAPWPQAAAGASGVFGPIIARCLRKKPVERYPDARALLGVLHTIEESLSSTGWRERAANAIGDWRRRPLIVSTVVLATFIAITYLALRFDGPEHVDADGASESATPNRGGPSIGPTTEKPTDGSNAVETPPIPPPAGGRNGRPSVRVAPTVKPSDPPVDSNQSDEPPSPPVIGRLNVTSDPRSSVSLDGNLTGVTPLTLEAAPGTHEVVLTGPNGLHWRGRITVKAGEVSSLHRDLTATGSLSVVSDVWYEVSLDAGPPEQTPIHFDRVAAGLHRLRISREGYVTEDIEIVIEEGTAASRRVTLEKKP